MGALGQMRKKVQGKPEPENATGLAVQMADPEESGKVPEGKKRQVEDLTAMFITFIHGDKTKSSIMEILSAFPNGQKSIPEAANTLMNKVEGQLQQRRMKVPNDVKIAAITYVVSDLALLGNKAQLWETPVQQEEIGPVLRSTIELYIKKGLKNKQLDPVQLQREAEALMTPEQRELGMKLGAEGQTPAEPTARMAAEQYAGQQVSKEQAKYAQLQQENEQLKAALQGGQAEEAEEIPAEQENQGALQGL